MSAGIFTNGPPASCSVTVYGVSPCESVPRSCCHVPASILPVSGKPLAAWKATTALRMFSAKRPSISPGENHARSRRICARITAAPTAPFASGAMLSESLIAASWAPDFDWGETDARLAAPSTPGGKASAAAAATTRAKRASTGSVVEFGGPLGGDHAGLVAIGGPAGRLGKAQLGHGDADPLRP